ncbi:MAG: nucleotidyltransferase family protein [Thermoanaerobaculia bacterium]
MDVFQTSPIPPHLREPLRAALRGQVITWPSLSDDDVRLLVDHGVAPLVYAVQPLPELRRPAIRAAALESLRADDLRGLLSALADRGLEVVITKGGALAYDVYAAPELRPRGDVDLLVSREHAAATIDAFRALGYEDRLTSGDEHAVRQVTLSRTDAHGVRHDYDLHWDIANTPLFASALRIEELRTIPLPRLGQHARGLGHVDALLLACIHRVAHHHDSDRLIWLVDVALLRERMTAEDHRRFWRQAADARVVGVCVRSIELADEWTSRAPHDRAEDYLGADELTREEPSRAFLDREITYGGVMLANFRALSWRARAQRAWQLAFPPAEFVRQSFGAQNRLTLPWLYLRRGVRGVARLFRRAT